MKKTMAFLLILLILLTGQMSLAESVPAVGSIVTFGTYEQDNDLLNGPEPIEWVVLDIQDGRVLLTSRYALDGMIYNEGYLVDTTWEECDLRVWLNDTFFNTAFTSEEQDRIPQVTVDNGPEQGAAGWRSQGGNDTQDRVYLLSFKEVGDYFADNRARMLQATPYALSKGIYVDAGSGNTWWWLRSAGRQQCRVATVSGSGTHGLMSHAITSVVGAVRPVIWVDIGDGLMQND